MRAATVSVVCATLILLILVDASLSAKSSRSSSSQAATSKRSKPRREARPSLNSRPSKSRDAYDDQYAVNAGRTDDEYLDQRRPSRGSPLQPPRTKGSSKGAVITYGERNYAPQRTPSGPTLRERLGRFTEDAALKYREVARMAKGVISSKYEKMLLQATWPDDEPVPPQFIAAIVGGIRDFRAVADTAPPDQDPYRITLRKLWAKMCEKDWRTTIKALYILHRISRDSHPKDAVWMVRMLRQMSHEVNPKNTPMHYFNLDQLIALDPTGDVFAPFVASYSIFLFKRATSFTSKFEELRTLSESSSEKQAVATLIRAMKILDYGFDCTLSKCDTQNYITCGALELVAADMRDLWKLYCSGVSSLVGQGPPYGGARAPKKQLITVLQHVLQARARMTEFVRNTGKALQQYRLRIPQEIETRLSEEMVKQKLNELLGSASSSSNPTPEKPQSPKPDKKPKQPERENTEDKDEDDDTRADDVEKDEADLDDAEENDEDEDEEDDEGAEDENDDEGEEADDDEGDDEDEGEEVAQDDDEEEEEEEYGDDDGEDDGDDDDEREDDGDDDEDEDYEDEED